MAAIQKSKVERYAVLGLVGVFVVVLAGSLKQLGVFGRRQSATPPTLSITQLPEMLRGTSAENRVELLMQAEAAARDVAIPALPTVQYTADHVRDPLKSLLPEAPATSQTSSTSTQAPRPAAVPAAPAVSVQGVLWGGSHPKAIVNGEVYAVGDLVQGARIVSIHRDGVTVESQGKSFQLPLSTSQGRQP
jgi:hypothetical protein